jgi:TrmH family RNA methyltransferase
LPSRLEFDRLIVVLVATRNPLNIGAAARAMSNFGFLRLRVVNPYEVAFREARSAVGASAVLEGAEEFNSLAEAIADCTLVVGTTAVGRRELQHPIRPLALGARLIRTRLAAGRVAILFGSEKVGLSNQDLSHCDWLMRIPAREEHRSVNLGQAVAICMYELARHADVVRSPGKPQPAKSGELERIAVTLVDALRLSGYLKPGARAATEKKVRRLIHRLDLSAADAKVWLGMLGQIAWKLRPGQDGP